jgi:hypothetical protein
VREFYNKRTLLKRKKKHYLVSYAMPVGKIYAAPTSLPVAASLGPKVINNPFLEQDAKRLAPIKRNFVVPPKAKKEDNSNGDENRPNNNQKTKVKTKKVVKKKKEKKKKQEVEEDGVERKEEHLSNGGGVESGNDAVIATDNGQNGHEEEEVEEEEEELVHPVTNGDNGDAAAKEETVIGISADEPAADTYAEADADPPPVTNGFEKENGHGHGKDILKLL